MSVKTSTFASHTVRYMKDSMVSNAHCQSGTEQTYYELFVPHDYFSWVVEWLTTHEHNKYKGKLSYHNIANYDNIPLAILIKLPIKL